MHTIQLHTASTIRFRRWSRVGYAVFCSLACSVTIGSLSVSVSDKMLQKADGITMNKPYFSAAEADSKEKEMLELEAALQQIQEISLSEISIDNTAACSQFFYYIINCNG
ncbi:MAG TPA: hypothetical protein VIK55_05395 [Paludibacter sp.]